MPLPNRFKPLKSDEEGKPETPMFLAFLYILFVESTSTGFFLRVIKILYYAYKDVITPALAYS